MTFTIAAIALVCGTAAAAPLVTYESPCECRDPHGKGPVDTQERAVNSACGCQRIALA